MRKKSEGRLADRRADRFCSSLSLVVALLGFVGLNGLACVAGAENSLPQQDPELPDVLLMCGSKDEKVRAEGRRLRSLYDTEFDKLLKKQPKLLPRWRNLADEKNGYLQWLQFCEVKWGVETQSCHEMDLAEDISQAVNGLEGWNILELENLLREHQPWIDGVTRIGLLPARSCRGVSADRLVSFGYSRLAIQSIELLCADAIVAASKGDGEKALIRLQGALGLAHHYRDVETPTLIMETVGVIGRFTVLGVAMKQVLPRLELKKENYSRWRRALSSSQRGFETLVLGESLAGGRGLVIPYVMELQNMGESHAIPDIDAFYGALARGYLLSVEKARSLKYSDYWDTSKVDPWIALDMSHLSPNSQELCQGLWAVWKIYGQGWVRQEARVCQYDAALAILAGELPPREMITGKPFVYDKATKVLSFPEDTVLKRIDPKPLMLP